MTLGSYEEGGHTHAFELVCGDAVVFNKGLTIQVPPEILVLAAPSHQEVFVFVSEKRTETETEAETETEKRTANVCVCVCVCVCVRVHAGN